MPVALLMAGVPATKFTMQSEMRRLPEEPLITNPAVRQASRNGKHGLWSVEDEATVFDVVLDPLFDGNETEPVAAGLAGLALLHAASGRLRPINRANRFLYIVFPLYVKFLVLCSERRENTLDLF